jgi:uncharacterized NAD(P)/FAD-binding protein YdhS
MSEKALYYIPFENHLKFIFFIFYTYINAFQFHIVEEKSVAIVGMGPRGLGILERLVANQAFLPVNLRVNLYLIDPKEPGMGVHSHEQPDHLFINTVAGQVTMFSDSSVRNAGPVREGPSLAEYANTDNDTYLPRATLGKYLSYVYQSLLPALSPQIRVSIYNTTATTCTQDSVSKRFHLGLADGRDVEVDYLFLTTGHSANRPTERDSELARFADEFRALNPLLAYYRTCYPLNTLKDIPTKTTVAVQGTGLSAHDVISEFTVGRGGSFKRDGRVLKYQSSGNEPHILLFSRQSLPFAARASNQKGIGGQHKARFFTINAIDNLRKQQQCSSQLDFELHLLPILIKEMAYAMRMASLQKEPAVEQFEPDETELTRIAEIFNPLKGQCFSNLEEFTTFFRNWIEADLIEARLGNQTSPIKAATDVLRDVRDNIRYAIEQSGLNFDSHRHFLEYYMPIMNRIAVGPPQSRNEELLALMDAGIVTLGGGPGAKVLCDERNGKYVIRTQFGSLFEEHHVDVLIAAKIESMIPDLDTSPVLTNLLANGLVRPYYNGTFHPGGIDITRDGHPIDKFGMTLTNCWALGNLTEGANFYTYILPRPLVNSRFISDAGRCIRQMIENICIESLNLEGISDLCRAKAKEDMSFINDKVGL